MSRPVACSDALSRLLSSNASSSPGLEPELARISLLAGGLRSACARLRGSHALHAALAGGVEALLTAYANALVALEEEVSCDPGLTPYHLRFQLRDFAVVLPAVEGFVAAATDSTQTTGSWVNRLYHASLDGDPVVARAAAALLRAVLQPLLAHVAHWMAYGELGTEADRGTFFVRAAPLPAPVLIASACGADDDSGARVQVLLAEAEYEWMDGHALDWDAVPSELLPPHVARTVLAVGKAVRMLRMQSAEWLAAEPRAPAAVLHPPSSWGGGAAGVENGSAAEGGVDCDGPAPAAADERFSSSDSIHIARVLAAVRSAPSFSPLVIECVVDRIRALVYRRLWTLLVLDSDLAAGVTGLRRHLLLGRGDLYQALLERIGPMRRAAAGAASPSRLCAGPLVAAAAATGVVARDEGGGAPAAWGGPLDAEEAGDAFFARCALTSSRRVVEWSRAAAGAAAAEALGAGGGDGLLPGGASQAAALAATVLRHWNASRVLAPDVAVRRQRGHGTLVAVGSAAIVPTFELGCVGGDAGGDGGGAAGGAPGASLTDLLMIARPAARRGDSGSGSGAGALWLSEALPLQGGFVLRCAVGLHAAAFNGGGGGGGAPLSPYANTASFAIVLQRAGCLVRGERQTQTPPGVASPAEAPASGAAGITGSLILHFLCKRLDAPADQRAGRSSLGGGGGDDGVTTGGTTAEVAVRRWRVVVAVYATPADATAPPILIASGALMDQELLQCNDGGGGGAAVIPALGATLQHDVLHLAVEYATTVPAPAQPAGGAAPAPPGKRIIVSALDGPAALGALQRAQGQPPAPAGTFLGSCSRTLVEAPLALEEVLSFGGVHGPGRGRAWVGFTADPAAPLAGAPLPPLVSLDAVDVAVHSAREDGALVDGLRLQYAVPWPLHVLLSGGAMALFGDVFALGLRCRARELALHECWRTLTASFRGAPVPPTAATGAWSAGGRRGVGDGGASAAGPSGVSAQLSDVRGRRDAAAAARQRAAVASHQVLRPVWLARARAAFVLGAWLRYLQTDVVEPAHAAYHAAVGAARDFPSLTAAHEALVRVVGAGAFLHSHLVQSTLDALLDAVDELTGLVAEHAAAGTLLDLLRPRGSRERFERAAGSLTAATRLLAAALQSAAPAAQAHALLVQLDFNGALTAPLAPASGRGAAAGSR